ncbi:hypothetical protein A5320_17340 [Rheinheimera sp. SA_1]|nr:hypothetical protein A5320_17340 [Rheinheimera sp. SA_1]
MGQEFAAHAVADVSLSAILEFPMTTAKTIKTRLLYAFAVPLLLMLGLGVQSYFAIQSMHHSIESLYRDRVIPLTSLKHIADAYAVNVIDAVNKANQGLFSATEAVEQLQAAQQLIAQDWQLYKQQPHQPDEQNLITATEPLLKVADQQIAQTIRVIADFNGQVTGQLSALDGPLYQHIDPISEQISMLIQYQLDQAKLVDASADEAYRHELMGLILFTLLAFIGSVIAGTMVARRILGQLGTEPATASGLVRDIAGGGLDVKMDSQHVKSGSLLHSLQQMVLQLVKVIHDVSHASQQLRANSQQLQQNSAGATASLSRQLRDIESVSAAMNEMTTSVGSVARSAQQAAQQAEQVCEQTSTSSQVMQQTQLAMTNLRLDIAESASAMQQLQDNSQQIGQVVEVIRGIADQTNLLALNAAIEAARAGEQGRGFAVVADEVRTLANRTQQSTQAIQQIITQLQNCVQSSVQAMAKSNAEVQQVEIHVENSNQGLQSLQQSARQIWDMSSEIASAATQQSVVADEINQNIHHIYQSSEHNNGAAIEVQRAAVDLQKIAHTLSDKINYFRLPA